MIRAQSTKTAAKKRLTLRRYTSLPALLDLLRRRKITLLSPHLWDDRNDAFFLAEYRQKTGAKSVLALCFVQSWETYHYWKVFADGSAGVCIEFDRANLIRALKSAGLQAREVDYRRIDSLQTKPPVVKDLPFLKRLAFRDEDEFRFVYVDHKEAADSAAFDIELKWVNHIWLSPWLPRSLVDSIKETVHAIRGCSEIKVSQTTLLENEKWKSVAKKAVKHRAP